MRVLIDTDVLLDVAMGRKDFVEDSAAVISWAEANPGSAAVAWHSLSNFFYLVRPDGRDFINELLDFIEVAPVDTEAMRAALGFPMKDLEDAMQSAAALAFGARHIVTRNLPHYRQSPVPAIKPKAFRGLVGG